MKTKNGIVKEFLIALIIFVCVMGLIGVLTIYATESNTPEENYTYEVLEDGTVEITKYLGKEAEVIIPQAIEGKTVTRIGYMAFAECGNLIRIVIPETVTSIDWGAFEFCSSLTSIEIPNSVTSIGDYVFWDCINLTNIEIPNSVTNIGDSAFYGCRNLTSIKIPENVTSIGYNSFMFCDKLEKIDVEVNNQTYSSEDGVLFDKQKTKLICYPQGKKDLEYIIPESVVSLDESSFTQFKYLTKITIPSSIINIDSNVFYFSGSLKEIIVAEDNANYCSVDGVLLNKDKTRIIKYPGEKTDLKYVIPETVTHIGNWAFSDCHNLTEITIPDEVINIGEFGFYNCSNLTNIIIPAGVTSIEADCFYGCSNFRNITIPEGVTSIGNHAFSDCSSLIEIELPNSITSIGEQAFFGCYGLTKIIIPENVTYIGSGALGSCESLGEITVDENNLYYCVEDGVLFNKEKTELISYPIGKDPTEYSIPEGVKNIYDWAFYGCNNMRTIIIPEGVEKIGSCAFGEIYSLTSLEIPESVTEFGYAPFTGSNLVLVNCNDNILNIETPEILKRAYNSEDVLYSEEIILTNCTLSEDLTQINVTDIKKNARIEINSGALEGLTIKVNIHNWDSETGTCIICGKTCTHEYDEGTVWQNATCEIEGLKVYTCAICEGNEFETIDKLSHSYENGECTECGTKEEIKNIEISSEEYTVTNNNITDIKPSTTVEELIEKITANGEIKLYKGETEVTDKTKKIGTGMKVKVLLNGEQKEYTLVVTGDLNGDGQMGDIDLLRMARYKAGLDNRLSGAYLEAADVYKDGNKADNKDLLKLVRTLVELDSL